MKRSREITKNNNNNNNDNCDLTPTTKCKKPKLVYRPFDVLPNEVVEMIMHAVPMQLWAIVRLVCASWCGAVDKHWAYNIGRKGPQHKIPTIRSMPGSWAIQHHNLPLLKWLVTTEGLRPTAKYKETWIGDCADHNNMEALQWLMNPSTGVYKPHVDSDKPYQPKFKSMASLAAGENTEMFLWVMKQAKPDLHGTILEDACGGGNVKTAAWIMKALRRERKDFSQHYCVQRAARNGHVEMLNWIYDCGLGDKLMWRGGLIDSATRCSSKDLGVIKWFRQKGLAGFDDNIVRSAVGNGNTTILDWWWKETKADDDEGSLFGTDMFTAYKSIHHFWYWVLEWLYKKNRLLISVNSLKMAVRGSHHDLYMLNWLWNHHPDTEKLEADMMVDQMPYNPSMVCIGVGPYSPRESLRHMAKGGAKCIPALNWFWDHGMTVAQRPEAVHGFHKSIEKLAEAKELETLRWLHHHNCVNLSKTCIYAINGCVDLDPYPSFLEGSCLLISPPSSE